MDISFVFIGMSCSGKTTISEMFSREHSEYGLSRIDVVYWVLKRVHLARAGEITQEELLSISYAEFFEALETAPFDIIEIASDDPEVHLTRIAKILKKHKRQMVIVLTHAPLEDCVLRNSARTTQKQVPVKAMEHQAGFTRGFFTDLCDRLNCQLIFIDTNAAKSPDESYGQLKEKVRQMGLSI